MMTTTLPRGIALRLFSSLILAIMTDTTPTKLICNSERAKSEPARQ
jgi:hypothetical protein